MMPYCSLARETENKLPTLSCHWLSGNGKTWVVPKTDCEASSAAAPRPSTALKMVVIGRLVRIRPAVDNCDGLSPIEYMASLSTLKDRSWVQFPLAGLQNWC